MDKPQTTYTGTLCEAITAAAKIWSNAPFPSKSSKAKTVKALLAFLEIMPPNEDTRDVIKEIEQWM